MAIQTVWIEEGPCCDESVSHAIDQMPKTLTQIVGAGKYKGWARESHLDCPQLNPYRCRNSEGSVWYVVQAREGKFGVWSHLRGW